MELVVLWFLPAAVIWCAVHTPRFFRFCRGLANRRQPSSVRVVAAPIERIAADLRRLQNEIERPVDDEVVFYGAVRRRAAALAFEDWLREACAALEIPHRLDELTGLEHRIEVLRVTAALEAAGLVLRPRERDTDADAA